MLVPELNNGDTIAIFSPRLPGKITESSRYHRAKSYLENKGVKLFEGNLTGRQDFYRSGSIDERARELRLRKKI